MHHIEHFYTTDFFQQSQFKKTDQLLSIYYTAQLYKFPYTFEEYKKPEKDNPVFFWKNLTELDSEILHFPIDKHVCSLIKEI